MDGVVPSTTAIEAVGSASSRRRMIGAVVTLATGTILGIAAVLQPASAGLGTHERLGLPACTWITIMDLPCPTCGMTTAFAHAADGNLLAALLAQPLGAVLALMTAMAFLVAGYVTLTGSRVATLFPRLWGRRAAWGLAFLVLIAWGYKILAYKGWLA